MEIREMMSFNLLSIMRVLYIYFLLSAALAYAQGSVVSPASRAVMCVWTNDIGVSELAPENEHHICWAKNQNNRIVSPWNIKSCSTYFDGEKGEAECKNSLKKDSFLSLPSGWTSIGVYNKLNLQTVSRWSKTELKSGTQNIKWYFFEPWKTKSIKFYLTKQGWNPNKTLSRDAFDLENPIKCEVSSTFNSKSKQQNGSTEWKRSNTFDPENWPLHLKLPERGIVNFQCDIPHNRPGYHLLLSVWKTENIGISYYSISDVKIINDMNEYKETYPRQVGWINFLEDVSSHNVITPMILTQNNAKTDISKHYLLQSNTNPTVLSKQIAHFINDEYGSLGIRAGHKDSITGKIEPHASDLNIIYAKKDSSVSAVRILVNPESSN